MDCEKYKVKTDGKKPMAEQASEQIIQYIIDQELEAGDKLPKEYELEQLLGVGRSTVREAVKALGSRNILESRRGSGIFICKRLGIVDDPLGFTFVKDKVKLARDLLDIRYLIEPTIASLAAQFGTEKQIAEIERRCRQMEEIMQANQPHQNADLKFHTAIANASGNMAMSALLPTISYSIDLFTDISRSIDLKQESFTSHREITEAIKHRDSQAAYDAMILHITYLRRYLREKMRDPGDLVKES